MPGVGGDAPASARCGQRPVGGLSVGRGTVDLGPARLGPEACRPEGGAGVQGPGLVSCGASREPGLGSFGTQRPRAAAAVSAVAALAEAGPSLSGDRRAESLGGGASARSGSLDADPLSGEPCRGRPHEVQPVPPCGVALGSGAIESAIRRVVNLRLKGNGILWEVENAEAMLALRAAALTGRWEEALDHARQTMARDRRVDWRWRSPDMLAELKAQAVNSPPSPQSPAEKAPISEAA